MMVRLPAFFDVAGGAEKAFGPLQGVGVQAAGEDLAAGRHHGVVGPGQAGDGIQQDDHVPLVLHQALGLFHDHFGHLDVALGRLVEGGTDHFGLDAALHVRHFLGPLVDEQHDEDDLRVVLGDAVGDVLEEHGLAGAGGGDDQAALAHADRRHQVHDPGGEILRVGLQLERCRDKGGSGCRRGSCPGPPQGLQN